MSDKITVMEWGRADQVSFGFDIMFPHNGPVLTLSPSQAIELREALADAISVAGLDGARPAGGDLPTAEDVRGILAAPAGG